MRKLRRLLLTLFLLGLIALATVFTVNTIAFTSKQISVKPVEPAKVSNETVERLAGAVKIPTVSYTDHIDTAAFLLLDTFFRKNYPLADSLLEKETISRFSYIYKWPGQNARLAPILLMAHLDVVPVENQGAVWTSKPFSGNISDGYVWGRGTMDDKGSACAILEAVEMLLKVDYEPQRTIYIALGHDEEIGGENGAKRIAETLRQRGVEFEFILDEGSMVVENAMPGLSKPLALIGVAEKGYATLELAVNLPEGGHSSMPPRESAINILSQALVRLRDNPSPARMEGPLRDMLETAGPEMDLFQKIIFANLKWTKGLVQWQMSRSPATNAMLRSTVAPTIISGGFKENVLPGRVSARVNCRILPGESVKSVMNYVYQTIGDDRVVVSLSKSTPASEPPPISGTGTFGYSILQTTVREVFPEAIVTPSLMVATTDSRHYQEISKNIYRFLPIQIPNSEIKRFHGTDERLSVEQYKQAVRFYRQLMLNACK